ncbi:response regulator [Sphingomonas oryzagri]
MTIPTPASPPPSRPRILLVEDDSAVRRSLQLLLQARGYEVRAHASGATMLEDPACAQAACMVADYRLDGLDGLEVLSRLRAKGWAGPALLITAHPSVELADRAAAGGFAQIIEKPFREGVVADAVARLTKAN